MQTQEYANFTLHPREVKKRQQKASLKKTMHYSESSRPVEWLKANYALLESLCGRSTPHLLALLFAIASILMNTCILYWRHFPPLNPEIGKLQHAKKKAN